MKRTNRRRTAKRLAGAALCATLLCIVAFVIINFTIDESYDVIAADILQKEHMVNVNLWEDETGAGGKGSGGKGSGDAPDYQEDTGDIKSTTQKDTADVQESADVEDFADIPDTVDGEDTAFVEEEPKETKYIALTFDDGPHQNYTPRILDTLAANEVVATFFIVGSRAETYPELVRQVHEMGHEVANHTYNHKNLTKISINKALDEIKKCSEAIEAACGQAPTLVRPPEGAITKELAKKLGYRMVLWTIDPQDWMVKDADTVVEHILENVKEGSVILLHDFYESTVTAVELLIPKLKEEGYEFVTVSQLIELREAEGENVSFVYR